MEIISAKRSRPWQVLLPLGIGTILALTGDLTLYAVLPAYAEKQAFSLAAVGLLLSANRLIRLGSNPLVGMLLAGSRRRSFVLTGFGLGTFSTLLYVQAQGTGLFLLGRLLWGISWSLIYIGSYTMLMDVTDESDRGWASGILQGFYFIGLALDPLLGGLLSDRLSFAGALSTCAGLSALGFVFALLTLPETYPGIPRAPMAFGQAILGALQGWKSRLASLKVLIHRQNAAVNYVYFAANFVGDGILLSTLSLYLQRHFAGEVRLGEWILPVATASGALLALRAIISALIAPLAGSFSDQSGKSGDQRRWASIACGLIVSASGLAIITGFGTSGAMVTGIVLAASGGAVILTVAPPLIREINPRQDSSSILGLLANSADLGMALAPLATYALLNQLPLETIYGLSAVGLAAGVLFIWAARR